MARSPHMITLGCRLNGYESDAMRAVASTVPDRTSGRSGGRAGERETIIINTCAVTNEAVRRSRQAARRARREAPDARIVVTGCAAQIAPQSFSAMDEVDAVLGNSDKLQPDAWRAIINEGEQLRVNDIMSVRETAGHLLDPSEGPAPTDRTRAYVQVQNGCDHRCTFCIIPYGRGPSRSVPMGEVVRHAEAQAGAGVREIVLTGVDVTSYGADLPGAPSLGKLVAKILKQTPSSLRVRLSSLDSIEIDPVLFDLAASEERVAPHLHLSLQSGDDMILKRMKRRHQRTDAIALCEALRARRPDIAFGADLIAGFPTETNEMFENSLRIVDECGLAYLHVFPFSPRDGAPAARMPQVPGPVIKARASRLRKKADSALARHLDGLIGHTRPVLMEKNGLGRTPCFAEVELAEGAHASPGTMAHVALTHRKATRLVGELRDAGGPLHG
ncbi:MAG: tRNA (N(6)-L-threonylcarbamoyladenosine(37)-C(2))-methylthiotransferase MtaB [Pseudomonadota bacterium]